MAAGTYEFWSDFAKKHQAKKETPRRHDAKDGERDPDTKLRTLQRRVELRRRAAARKLVFIWTSSTLPLWRDGDAELILERDLHGEHW